MAELWPLVLAHGEGGWDELLIFAVPAAVVLLVYVAGFWREGRKESQGEPPEGPGGS